MSQLSALIPETSIMPTVDFISTTSAHWERPLTLTAWKSAQVNRFPSEPVMSDSILMSPWSDSALNTQSPCFPHTSLSTSSPNMALVRRTSTCLSLTVPCVDFMRSFEKRTTFSSLFRSTFTSFTASRSMLSTLSSAGTAMSTAAPWHVKSVPRTTMPSFGVRVYE